MHRLIGIAVCVLALTACDKVPLLAPSGSTVTLNVSHATLSSNGSAEVTATVIESSGTPVQNGTLVNFTTTVGQLQPSEARTSGGSATVRLLPNGASGVATIRALSGGAKSDAVELRIGTSAVETISLSATPGSVPATGGTVTLTASVVDAAGRPVPGVSVTFSATQGVLSATVAITNAEGQAVVTLTSSAQSEIRANAGSKSATATVAVRTATGFTLTSSASPTEDTPMTVTVTPATGGGVIRDVELDFGDGRSLQIGTLTAAITVNHTYTSSGTFTLRASGIDVSGDTATASTAVVVAARPLIAMTISTTPVDPLEDTVTTVTVTMGTLPAGTTVNNVVLDYGDGSATFNLGPVASGGTVSAQHRYTSPRTVTIKATATDNFGGKTTAAIQKIVTARPPITMSISTEPISPREDQVTTVTVTLGTLPAGTTVTNMALNYGDGSATVNLGPVASAGTVSAQHEYTEQETVTITATATDNFGGKTIAKIQRVVIP